jgi:protein phosphatase
MAIIEFVMGAALIRFMVQSIVLDLLLPCVVIGDIHGNFHCLILILASIRGSPHDEALLLGECVDHGQYRLDVLILIFWSYKA